MSPNWSLLWTCHLGYTIRTLTDHSNKPGSWSFFLCLDPSWLNKPYSLKTWGTKQKNSKKTHKKSKIRKKNTQHSLFLFPCSIFFVWWPNSIGKIRRKKIKKIPKKKISKKVTMHFLLLFSWPFFCYNDLRCEKKKFKKNSKL